MNSISVGELYHVPQDVLLMQSDPTGATMSAYYKTYKPITVVVVGEAKNNMTEVLYNGQKWKVNEKDLYVLER
tara:strand:- start:281 stop:499 length:219 start_codon:yes stop_codon:yes gene_type:complete